MGNNGSRTCYKCSFLKRSVSVGNSLVYLCQKWQLRCIGILPYKTVKDSIDKECPFFIPKLSKTQIIEDTGKNGFDVIA